MAVSFDISIEKMYEDSRPRLLIDMRREDDYNTGTADGARNVPAENFPADPASLEKLLTEISEVSIEKMMNEDGDAAVPVYLLCYTGRKSHDTALFLREYHIEAYSIEGGYESYIRYQIRKMTDPSNADTDGKTSGRETDDDGSSSQRTSGRELCEAGSDPYKEAEKKAERSIQKTFRRELWKRFIKAIREYNLIEDGDRICVCISGGKDSMLMAKLFQELYRHGIRNFSLKFLIMDPGYNDINRELVMANARLLGIPVETFQTSIYDIVSNEEQSGGSSPCYLCARMRRGWLYHKAEEMGCNKIALGHHLDDVIETTLMGMLYAGQIQTMMPKLHSKNFPGMELIRPMYFIREKDIIRWRNYNNLHFINCACRLTESCASCGGEGKGSKRAAVKRLIKKLEKEDPQIVNNILKSMSNVSLSMVLSYKDRDGRKHDFLDEYDAKISE
jgi:tRNA(Ile)-lysidine synthase TilS/MesJ/rhodanese-related sulfurtransferase